jgi:hypothetical protein
MWPGYRWEVSSVANLAWNSRKVFGNGFAEKPASPQWQRCVNKNLQVSCIIPK